MRARGICSEAHDEYKALERGLEEADGIDISSARNVTRAVLSRPRVALELMRVLELRYFLLRVYNDFDPGHVKRVAAVKKAVDAAVKAVYMASLGIATPRHIWAILADVERHCC